MAAFIDLVTPLVFLGQESEKEGERLKKFLNRIVVLC